MNTVCPDDLVPLNAFTADYPVILDVVYAQAGHPDNHFGQVYHPEAKILWAHKDIAAVTLLAACIGCRQFGWDACKVYDALRPVEAQEIMRNSGIDPLLVAGPGKGAHPRAMAVDIEPVKDGQAVDMGTPFDDFSGDPSKNNPAGRTHTDFGPPEKSTAVRFNRVRLDFSIQAAAALLGTPPVLPYPYEWWDFRFYEEVWGEYEPFREQDLYPYQRLIDLDLESMQAVLNGTYPDGLGRSVRDVQAKVQNALRKLDLQAQGKA